MNDPIVQAALDVLERTGAAYSPVHDGQASTVAFAGPGAQRPGKTGGSAQYALAVEVAAAVLDAAASVREQTTTWDNHGPQFLRGRARHARLSCR